MKKRLAKISGSAAMIWSLLSALPLTASAQDSLGARVTVDNAASRGSFRVIVDGPAAQKVFESLTTVKAISVSTPFDDIEITQLTKSVPTAGLDCTSSTDSPRGSDHAGGAVAYQCGFLVPSMSPPGLKATYINTEIQISKRHGGEALRLNFSGEAAQKMYLALSASKVETTSERNDYLLDTLNVRRAGPVYTCSESIQEFIPRHREDSKDYFCTIQIPRI